MPELHDEHGAPKLWGTLRCLVPGCGAERIIEPDQAERLAQRLSAGVGVRYYLTRLKCRQCGFRNASIAFHLAYAGKRPWDDRHQPGEPRKPFAHEGGDPHSATPEEAARHKAIGELPVVVRGGGSKRKTK